MQAARVLAPNLDDRTWEDIVDEAKSRIAELCPEWTDHNPSDPGITLIELFAGMAEMIIYRLNQVPEKNYIAFLNLLGITRDPPTPATVDLEFTFSKQNVTIPKGTQVSTRPTEQEEAIIFETDKEVALQGAVGTVKATTALTIREPEELGRSTGEAFQVFALGNEPLYQDSTSPDRLGHLEIRVDGEIWKRVDEFQKGNDRSYRCNPVTVEILFGEGDNVPKEGLKIVATRYRYVVGGIRSNVPAHTLTLLRAPIDGVKEVTNPAAAAEASEWQPLEEALREAPQAIKSIDRAVTAGDYQFLAMEATTDVAKAKCLGPKKIPGSSDEDPEYEKTPLDRGLGKVNLLPAPNISYDPKLEDEDEKTANRKPDPSYLFDEVRSYLNARRVMTSELILSSPHYVEISVEALVFIPTGESPDAAEKNVKNRLQAYLHPISGGADGHGWEIGQDVYIPQVFEAINNIAGVNYVDALIVKRNGAAAAGVRVQIEEHELACAAAEGDFNITVKPDEGER